MLILDPRSPPLTGFVLFNLGFRPFFPSRSPTSPGGSMARVTLAAMLWVLGFAFFFAIHAPMLLRPRVDGKPG
ncbi:MAG: hypothetical protein ACP5OY_03300 [Halothiobacillaceae bacterium]